MSHFVPYLGIGPHASTLCVVFMLAEECHLRNEFETLSRGVH